MVNKIFLFVLGLIAFIAFGLGLYNFVNTPKVGYARAYDLVDKYAGTKEARVQFETKKMQWQSNIDSLNTILQNSREKFSKESRTMSTLEIEEMRKYLERKEQEVIHYTQAIETKAQEDDKQMMQAVLNQVNSYVEEYGKENGYDVILGTSTSGSVLFAQQKLDITEDILEGLNKTYHGKK